MTGEAPPFGTLMSSAFRTGPETHSMRTIHHPRPMVACLDLDTGTVTRNRALG